MYDDDKNYYEIQLDNKWLIIIFIVFVVILGLVFVWGMKVGRETAELEQGLMSGEKTNEQKSNQLAEEDLSALKQGQNWRNESKKNNLETYDLKTDFLDRKNGGKAAGSEKKDSGSKDKDLAASKTAVAKQTGEGRSDEGGSSTKAPEITSGAYIIQILSIKDKQKAEYYVKVLKDEGYPASLTTVELGNQGYFYRVRVGGYETREKAQSEINKILKEEKLQPILKGKKNLLIVKQF